MGPKPKPKVKLTNRDGNAFAILASCKRAARLAGWSDDRIAKFRAEATKGDYDHLLRTAVEYFDVE